MGELLKKVENNFRVAIIMSFLSSIAMAILYSFLLTSFQQDLLEIVINIGIIWALHLPLLLGVYKRLSFFYSILFLGWLITWGGFLYYGSQDNGMQDLVTIIWVIYSWVVTHAVAFVVSLAAYVIKKIV